MPESFVEYDRFIHHEMLAHPAIFTHQQATQVAIINGQQDGIANEVLKHTSVRELWQVSNVKPITSSSDKRINYFTGSEENWLQQSQPQSLDIIILPEKSIATPEKIYNDYFNLLRDDGILIQLGESFFAPLDLKSMYQTLQKTGFHDIQVLHFPQPSFPSGWRAAIMAIKARTFKRVRETDIYNKPFVTRYYNFDVHKAALVMPEFIRAELAV
jgi:spermidine synthase